MLAGRSGVAALTEDWAQRLPCQIAARAAVEPTTVVDRVQARKLDRCEMFASRGVQGSVGRRRIT